MRKLYAWLGAMALILSLGLIVPSSATAAPFCGIYWGSLAKANSSSTHAPIIDVRSGRHACFDRLVVDIRGDGAGYDVRYVNRVRADGSGQAVWLRGGADLSVTINAPGYNRHGNATYRPADRRHVVNVSNYSTFRQVALVSSFEGKTKIGLGVRARLPFRTFVLDGPGDNSRVVIDVAHRW
ncbi:AMIN-like domain-containing (lipo)protein [Arthrobacter castelli]|uniref:AMIN-like domain-containing (lipo)protein n=1 Tax=Arthrobacter castelli TaxID=271431 RepID=UPI00047DEA24|nr:hypothetical protein [Arthrobacter castelli]